MLAGRFFRRRILRASLIGAPLLAACSSSAAKPASDVASQPVSVTATEPPEPLVAASSAPAIAAPATPAPSPTPVAAPHIRTVVLDPGHGGEEIGAASAIPGLPNLLEKDSNLAMGLRLRELLEADGYRVVMTREEDGHAIGWAPPPPNLTPPPGAPAGPVNAALTGTRADLQARVDRANDAHGDLFLSLHSNDNGSTAENGVEVWYCADREDGAANAVWAQIVLDSVLEGLRGYGYAARNRGIQEDHFFRVRNGQNFHIFVLGPANPGSFHPRATNMPAALVENLFMRNPADIRVLRDPAAREAIAQSLRLAVGRFFEWRGA